MNSSRYICISIPTIRRSNLNNYEKIATCKSYNYENLKYLRHQSQRHIVFIHLEVHREKRETLEDETCSKVLRIPYNHSDLVESLSLSLPHGFSLLEFFT